MTYATRADIEARFGKVNVETWANLDNADPDAPEVAGEITARIDRAIEVATARIDDAFRGSRFKVPLEPTAGNQLVGITEVCAALAGTWLYESRGIDEQDEDGRPFNRLATHRRWAERQIGRYLREVERMPAQTVIDGPRAPFIVG